jgi:hypothetical protein
MYCIHCGHPNVETNKFCEKCGKPIAHQVSQPSQRVTLANLNGNWIKRTPSIGSLIVIVCFFLPWVLVSCSVGGSNDTGIRATGYEIASGDYSAMDSINQFGQLFGSNTPATADETAYPILGVIPLLGMLGLITLNGKTSGSVIAIVSGLLGIGGMIFFTISATSYGNELALTGLQLKFQGGYWGTWIGFLWQTLIAIMTVKIKS